MLSHMIYVINCFPKQDTSLFLIGDVLTLCQRLPNEQNNEYQNQAFKHCCEMVEWIEYVAAGFIFESLRKKYNVGKQRLFLY